jgi:hypothetical protein
MKKHFIFLAIVVMTATLLFPANAKEIKREDRFYSHTL